MATLVACHCECGYSLGDDDVDALGCGSNLAEMDRCWWPARCASCRAVVNVDLAEPEVRCETCGQITEPYVAFVLASPTSIPAKGTHKTWRRRHEVASWHSDRVQPHWPDPLYLFDLPYLCPACERYGLRFEDVGSAC